MTSYFKNNSRIIFAMNPSESKKLNPIAVFYEPVVLLLPFPLMKKNMK